MQMKNAQCSMLNGIYYPTSLPLSRPRHTTK
jgi:hypothetical protein